MENPCAPLKSDSPEGWVEAHGNCLFYFALRRVHQSHLAEDLVQETFLAGLRNRSSFSGRSQVRSWLIGILKNKICDYFRTQGREQTFTDLDLGADSEEKYFNENRCWRADGAPQQWSVFHIAEMDRSRFRSTLAECVEKLPRRVANVFLMREVDELTTKEICELMSIPPNHLWVMLHRARAGLRRCLEVHWFELEKKS